MSNVLSALIVHQNIVNVVFLDCNLEPFPELVESYASICKKFSERLFRLRIGYLFFLLHKVCLFQDFQVWKLRIFATSFNFKKLLTLLKQSWNWLKHFKSVRILFFKYKLRNLYEKIVIYIVIAVLLSLILKNLPWEV